METPSEQNVIIYFLNQLSESRYYSLREKDNESAERFIDIGGKVIQEFLKLIKIISAYNQFKEQDYNVDKERLYNRISLEKLIDIQPTLFPTFKDELNKIENKFYKEIGFEQFWKNYLSVNEYKIDKYTTGYTRAKAELCSLWLATHIHTPQSNEIEDLLIIEAKIHEEFYFGSAVKEPSFCSIKTSTLTAIMDQYNHNSMIAIRKIISYITAIKGELVPICTLLLSSSSEEDLESFNGESRNYSLPLDTLSEAYRIAHDAGLLKIIGKGQYSPIVTPLKIFFSEWKDLLLDKLVSIPSDPELAKSLINPRTNRCYTKGKINKAKIGASATKKTMDAYLDER